MKVMALLGSSRKNGNTEYLIRQALEGIEHDVEWLMDKTMHPIIDLRHADQPFGPVDDDYEELILKFLEQDIIFFATPLYWFGMSGQMKTFFDRWSQYLRDSRFDFKQELGKKKAYVIVVGESPDPKVSALPLIQQFSLIFNYAGIEFADYVIGKANKPGEIHLDTAALSKVQLWNENLKKQFFS